MLLVTGTEIDVAHASQQAPLGSVAYDNSGNFYRYIKNNEAATAIEKGRRAALQDSSYNCVRAVAANEITAPLAEIMGVAQQSDGIPAQQFGWVMYEGIATCFGTSTAGSGIMGAASGEFAVLTNDKPSEGVALSTAAGAAFTARISY